MTVIYRNLAISTCLVLGMFAGPFVSLQGQSDPLTGVHSNSNAELLPDRKVTEESNLIDKWWLGEFSPECEKIRSQSSDEA